MTIMYSDSFTNTINSLKNSCVNDPIKTGINTLVDNVIMLHEKYPATINNTYWDILHYQSNITMNIRNSISISALYYGEGTSRYSIFDGKLYTDCIKFIDKIIENPRWRKLIVNKRCLELYSKAKEKYDRIKIEEYRDSTDHIFEYDIKSLTIVISRNGRGLLCYRIYPTIILREYFIGSDFKHLLHELTIGYGYNKNPLVIDYKFNY